MRPVNLEKPRQSPQPNGPESSVAVSQAGCQDVNDSQVVSRVQSNKLVTNQEYRTSRELTITSSTSPQLLDSCASTLERYLLALSLAFRLNMTWQRINLFILDRSDAYHSASYKSCEENQVTDSELEQLNGFLTSAAATAGTPLIRRNYSRSPRAESSRKSPRSPTITAATKSRQNVLGDGGYEGDTDDTLTRQQRKSVKDLARYR